MIVLVVVGIMLSTALLFIRSPGPEQMRQEAASRVWAVSKAARDEAVLRHQVLGLRLESGSYQVLVRQNGSWSAPRDESFYRQRTLPAGVELQLVTSDWAGDADAETTDKPQVLFLPNGEVSPFELAVRNTEGSGYAVVRTDEYNDIRLGGE